MHAAVHALSSVQLTLCIVQLRSVKVKQVCELVHS